MPSVLAYYRPESLDEASNLLAASNRRAVSGGTVVVPDARVQRDEGVELVDLQGLGLDQIEADGDCLTLGAMVTLGELMSASQVPELVRSLAQRELPSALRNQATIGGTIGSADPDSILLAGLLVHEAVVHIHGSEPRSLPEVLAGGTGGIVTSVSIATTGAGVVDATGRTPADTPIVSAVARAGSDGVKLALTGVAATPMLADPVDPTAGLTPSGDFRGSPDYRLHLAKTLSRRVVAMVAS